MQRNDTSVSGYFSNQTALRDTAILSVPSFEPLPSGWSHFAKGFLRKATRQGKKNLLIDLSGNPGGAIVAGFGLFAELFPGKEMYLGSRLRSHESAHSLEKIFSHLNDSAAFAEGVDNANPFVYQAQVSPDQKHAFKSWHDLYRPHDVSGANFSSPFAVFNLTALSNNDTSPINGYGPIPLQPKRSAFAPENITIVSIPHSQPAWFLLTDGDHGWLLRFNLHYFRDPDEGTRGSLYRIWRPSSECPDAGNGRRERRPVGRHVRYPAVLQLRTASYLALDEVQIPRAFNRRVEALE